jgi:exodeoxyribonuclease VIII
MKDAVISTMTESEYRSLPALNASRFKAFYRSPYHFFNQKEVETTEAMRIGTAVHTAMLEPELYDSTIGYMPDVDGRTNEGKAIKKAFAEQYAGKTILKAESKEIVQRACIGLQYSNEWKAIKAIPEMRYEQVILADLQGIHCKARLDLVDVERGIIRDIKTCDDAGIVKFCHTVKDRLYWLQSAFYVLMAEKAFGKPFNFEFIAVETSDPSSSLFHPVDEEEMKLWKSYVMDMLLRYGECVKTDTWPKPRNRVIHKLYIPYAE